MIDKLDVSIINTLTISELYVLRFIDKNKKITINSSVKELAETTFVSTATIMRVAKKLGFSGFAELKYVLRQELVEEENEENRAKGENSPADIKKRLTREITQTAENINEDLIIEVAELLNSNKKIHFFAKGLTLNVFEYASKQLQTAYRPVYLYNDTHIAYINAEMFTKDDVIFLASLSGNTHQVVRVANIAKSRHAKIITITGRRDNELSKIGDINFKVANERVGSTKHDFSSRLAMIYLMEVIIGVYLNTEGVD